MRQDYSDISVVLDRSGSMQAIREDTIGGFNAFLADQKIAPGIATFTLAQFDTEYDVAHDGLNIADVPALTTDTFVPRGATALLDAVGRTINATGARLGAIAEADRPANVIFVIVTDGQENSSKEFNLDQINKQITHQREVYKWNFIFLGANQDAIAAGEKMGLDRGLCLSVAASPAGARASYRSASAQILGSRRGAVMKFTVADREAQKAAGAK